VKLSKLDPAQKGDYPDKQSAQADTENNLRKLEKYQDILHTQTEHGLLIVLQALDAGGKDGTIRHVMGAFNPMGCSVVSFKVPTDREAQHDFLWRIHPHAPAHGRIAIFNRSHYEDVLVARVHKLVPKKVWSARYDHINAFERLLADSGITVRKFYLHISKDEQRQRLEDRLHDPSKNWKFNLADLDERKHWDDYIDAYEDVFKETSTPWAPWYIIPANHKWYRNLVISQILVETLKDMDLQYPPPVEGLDKIHVPE
jgi:PPK2 family polyphosphate:nucleotide phosphotransferase